MESPLKVKDLVKLFGVTEKTIIRWITTGDLKGIKLGKSYYVRREDLREVVERGFSERKY